MIPRAYITAWRAQAPWPSDAQVEQDLVLARALTDVFSCPVAKESLAFRGGTALHKLYFDPPGRYSEDLDLVQMTPGPIGPVLDELREVLDPWLGAARWDQKTDSVRLVYRFETTMLPVQLMRLKIEINTREPFSAHGVRTMDFAVDSPWHQGVAGIRTFDFEELLATKLRALYQRKKGRDLYDLWLALITRDVDVVALLECFTRYMERGVASISRAQFEENLAGKLDSTDFRDDVIPLLRDRTGYDVTEAADLVHRQIVSRLDGETWRGEHRWR